MDLTYFKIFSVLELLFYYVWNHGLKIYIWVLCSGEVLKDVINIFESFWNNIGIYNGFLDLFC